jgi:hypothetical protein
VFAGKRLCKLKVRPMFSLFDAARQVCCQLGDESWRTAVFPSWIDPHLPADWRDHRRRDAVHTRARFQAANLVDRA